MTGTPRCGSRGVPLAKLDRVTTEGMRQMCFGQRCTSLTHRPPSQGHWNGRYRLPGQRTTVRFSWVQSVVPAGVLLPPRNDPWPTSIFSPGSRRPPRFWLRSGLNRFWRRGVRQARILTSNLAETGSDGWSQEQDHPLAAPTNVGRRLPNHTSDTSS